MELTIEQALQQGVAAHKEGKLVEAKRLYQAILQSQPAHPDANHNLGLVAVSVNKADLALPLFKTAVEANPTIEQFWLSYIGALIIEQQFENAKQLIEQAKQQGVSGEKLNVLETQLVLTTQINEPKLVVQKKNLTLSEKRKKLAEQKKQKKAKKQTLKGINPSETEINNLLQLYKNGQFGDAETLALSITHKFPSHQIGWKVLGAILGQTGRIIESLAAMKKSVQLAPQDAAAHSNLGITLKELGRLEDAEASGRQAISLKPDYAEAHNNLGITLKELGKLDEAEASYTQAIVLKPNYAEAHYNLGIILKELGVLEEAEASYMQAIRLKPNHAKAHNNLGNMLKELGRMEEAEASLKQAIVQKPDLFEAHNNLGIILRNLGRLDEAETSYRQSIALKSDFAEAHCNLGVTLHELGILEEAEDSFRQAIVIKPDYPFAKHMLAALSGETTTTAPRDYVEGLFDHCAAKFEHSLVDNLEYKIPKMIVEMILKNNPGGMLGSILDLGCGTGLTGLEIKKYCTNLEGIDLSARMLDEARKKNAYDRLAYRDIVDYLFTENLNFDYFVSTDVFIYIGDLSNIFKLIKSQNNSGGKLVFSTEHTDKGEFCLEKSGRYSHSKTYIESLCEKFNYSLAHFEIVKLRKEKDGYLTGGLYLLDF
jgi:predicted TPR repeat methyltransferase